MTTTTGKLTLAGGAIGFNWLPVHVAIATGMLDKRGLSVELKRMGTVDKATAAVLDGSADLAISPPEGALASAASGGRLRILAGNVNRLPLTLVANPSITSISELRGKVVGTSSMTEGTMIYTQEVLRQHGLHYPADYQFSAVGIHTARWEALQKGEIDAAVQLVPYNFIATDAGYTDLGELTDYIPNIIFTALLGDLDWAERNSQALESLLDALREATAFIYDPANDERLLPLIAEAARIDDQRHARRALDYARAIAVFSPDLGISDDALQTSVNLMVRAGLLDTSARADAERALDLRFLEAGKGAS